MSGSSPRSAKRRAGEKLAAVPSARPSRSGPAATIPNTATVQKPKQCKMLRSTWAKAGRDRASQIQRTTEAAVAEYPDAQPGAQETLAWPPDAARSGIAKRFAGGIQENDAA